MDMNDSLGFFGSCGRHETHMQQDLRRRIGSQGVALGKGSHKGLHRFYDQCSSARRNPFFS
eukprot:scaffold28397_cov76-Amphora_coffeaeformis.AAC.1